MWAKGVFPDVPDARGAVKVADGGRFYVQLPYIRLSWIENYPALCLVQPEGLALAEPTALHVSFRKSNFRLTAQQHFCHD
jgi:hypothetical protein